MTPWTLDNKQQKLILEFQMTDQWIECIEEDKDSNIEEVKMSLLLLD